MLRRLQFLVLLLLYTCSYALAQIPRVDSVQPAQGPIAGGTVVTITGANFSGATIKVSRTAATPVSQSDTQILLQMPPQDNGIALISIRNAAGTGYGEFLYIPPRLQDLPPGYITTIAGAGSFAGDGRPATRATLQDPRGIAVDSNGNTYIAEAAEYWVRRIRPDGIIETVAGTGLPGGCSGPGPALELTIAPRGIAVDAAGNLYAPDGCGCVSRLDARTGIITNIAGTGIRGFSGDGGPAVNAQFNCPGRIAVGNDGNVFVLDCGNARIRRISPDGTISTFAGTGTPGFSGDGGPATEAQFNFGLCPDNGGLAVDPGGNLYIADTGNRRVRKIDRRTGIITTFASLADGFAVATDSQGNVFFATNTDPNLYGGGRIFRANASGQITATYGKSFGYSPDGTPASQAAMANIDSLSIELNGNILFSEASTMRVRRINVQTGLLETVAGMGPSLLGETGPAVAAVLENRFNDLAILPTGELLVADQNESRLRKIDAQGNISTVAGTGFSGGFSASEGPALEVQITPFGVDIQKDGTILYVQAGSTVHHLDVAGMVRRVAGSGYAGPLGDGGPATEASFTQPWDVVADDVGNLFIADTNNNRVRRVDTQTGTITTVAGSGPSNGVENYGGGSFCGDGGPAVQACLNTPFGVAIDQQGHLFIADTYNNRIRKVDAAGTMTTFAQIQATKLAFDSSGNLYILSGQVYRISPDGLISRIAGQYRFGFSGDGGPALNAQFSTVVSGIAIDAQGDVFVSDGNNRRIRAVRFGAVMTPPDLAVSFQVTRGTPQDVPVNSRLATPLEATLRDQTGNPLVGVRVDFSAPASGPTCLFNGSTSYSALTDRFGKVYASCLANRQAGSYTITATPLAANISASFSLTNIASQTPMSLLPALSALTLIPQSATGGGFLTRIFLRNLASIPNTVVLNRLSQSGTLVSSAGVTLRPSASFVVADPESQRSQSLTTQWLSIGSEQPVAAAAVFDCCASGPQVTSAVGILAQPPGTSFTAPFIFQRETATQPLLVAGLALANRSDQANAVTLRLMDESGNTVAQQTLAPLAPFGQTALTVSELLNLATALAGRNSFLGSLQITATQPFAPVYVGNLGGRLFSLPLTASSSTSMLAVIPHFVTGGGYVTRVFIQNLTTGRNNVRMDFMNQNGSIVRSETVTLAASQTIERTSGEASRSAPVATQWIAISGEQPISAVALFDCCASGPQVTSAVGVLGQAPGNSFLAPFLFQRDTTNQPLLVEGLGLANRSVSSNTVTVRLVDEFGTELTTDTLAPLPPMAQTAFTVSDLPNVRNFLGGRSNFLGSLTVTGTQSLAPVIVGNLGGRLFSLPLNPQ